MSEPRFSVVVPTCRRPDLLARCLESLQPGTQLADPSCYEVIVTDDARGETARDMMRAKFPWARWVEGPARGPAANRNNGAHHATGEWVCLIDDDCVASPGWIAAFRETAANNDVDLIEGRTTVPDPADDPFLHSVSNHNGGGYWSCNLAIRRDCFIAVGGFDEDFLAPAAEDMEFAHRLRAHHPRARFVPEALVLHPARRIGWHGIWKKHLLNRWAALYDYKIDQTLHLTASPARNVARAFVAANMSLLRTTWRDLRDLPLPYWKTRNFWLLVRWVTFPVYLPYYLYWVYRFQQQLLAKAHARELIPDLEAAEK
jgi:GT2 family glycosyltransferase